MQIDNKVEALSLKKNLWRGLTITDSAAHQILRLIKNDPAMLGLRLSVKQSGCAGITYVMEKVIHVDDGDCVYVHNGARLYVPIKAMPFIDGTELNYVQEGVNHMFKFNNPKAKHACGCGESFGL
ncbi:Fe-S cluster assembly scaffold SufA [Candidatus Doolittlea endobia]|uniref:Iron-binding protein IscA n=1 Tax=Candidatus Doolittlea endobia TaxID=1778262 RepID=A0A143WT28_9ENTR|nr:Fe-S cluster assembly scaffold SufA [Candidatus Doolittlea endobia]CUX96697.1 Iron-binding protein IscA [Candidatus Doolittlea endobia]